MRLKLCRAALAAVGLIAAFAFAAAAQDNGPITGGYGDISVRSKDARSAAALAVKRHSSKHPRDRVTLVKILKAEQQVVAGLNYRLCILVKNRRGRTQTITAVIFKPIRGPRELTNWEPGGCREI